MLWIWRSPCSQPFVRKHNFCVNPIVVHIKVAVPVKAALLLEHCTNGHVEMRSATAGFVSLFLERFDRHALIFGGFVNARWSLPLDDKPFAPLLVDLDGRHTVAELLVYPRDPQVIWFIYMAIGGQHEKIAQDVFFPSPFNARYADHLIHHLSPVIAGG